MFLSILKAIGFIGGLVVAGISAYSAYKRSTSSMNYGSHTMVGGNDRINALQALIARRRAQAAASGYGYGYSAPATVTVEPNRGYCGAVADSVQDEINRLKARIADLKQQIAAIMTHTQAAAQEVEVIDAQVTNEVPVDPMPMPTPQLPTNMPIPVTPAITAADEAMDARNEAWEHDGDRILSQINNNCNANMGNTQINSQQMYAAPMSDLGRGALNYSYNFNMNNRFEQFWDTELYKMLASSRAQQQQPYNYNGMMNPYINTPNPVQTCIGMNTHVPQQVIDVNATELSPVNNRSLDTLFDDCPVRKSEPYGHYGPGMPSTRCSYPFG